MLRHAVVILAVSFSGASCHDQINFGGDEGYDAGSDGDDVSFRTKRSFYRWDFQLFKSIRCVGGRWV